MYIDDGAYGHRWSAAAASRSKNGVASGDASSYSSRRRARGGVVHDRRAADQRAASARRATGLSRGVSLSTCYAIRDVQSDSVE